MRGYVFRLLVAMLLLSVSGCAHYDRINLWALEKWNPEWEKSDGEVPEQSELPRR